MKKITILVFAILLLQNIVYAVVPVKNLIEQGDLYDNKWLEIAGEAFGDKMPRGDKVWINVLSPEDTAIGVLFSRNQADKIKTLGNYNYRGDKLLIKGFYRRYFQKYGGETAFEAFACEIQTPGYRIDRQLDSQKVLTSCVLIIIFLILVYMYKRKKTKAPGKNS